MVRKKFVILTVVSLALILNFANAGDCEDEVVCEKVVPQLQSVSTQVDQFPRHLEEALTRLSKSFDNVINERTTRLEQTLESLASQLDGFSKTLQQMSKKPKSRELQQKKEKNTADQKKTPKAGNNKIKPISVDDEIFPDAAIDATAYFATSKHYSNVRMVTNLTSAFPSQTFPKHLTTDEVHADCCHSCWKQQNCHAFNLIVKDDSYVCEYLADNYCLNTTNNVLLNWPGSTLWDMLPAHMYESCLDAKFPSGQEIPCGALRPGCSGNWPQCTNCSRTCTEISRKHGSAVGDHILWPEGDGAFVTPIFAICSRDAIFFVHREVNMETGEVVKDHRMSFYDIHRIARLDLYRKLIFRFVSTDELYYQIFYYDWFIDANGTLMNMTYADDISRLPDIFNLNGQPLQPTPFVTVTDDRYGCGSFWAIDANNATYCPGGKASMLGKVQVENGEVVNTGMALPGKEDEKINVVGIFCL